MCRRYTNIELKACTVLLIIQINLSDKFHCSILFLILIITDTSNKKVKNDLSTMGCTDHTLPAGNKVAMKSKVKR